MSESTRLGRARGKMLPVAITATALLAMLVIAPLASAASNPIASGTTTLTINAGNQLTFTGGLVINQGTIQDRANNANADEHCR